MGKSAKNPLCFWAVSSTLLGDPSAPDFGQRPRCSPDEKPTSVRGDISPFFYEATGDSKQQTYWTHVDISYNIICCWGWPLKTKLDIDQRNYIDILTETAGDIDQQKNELNVETGEYEWNLSAHQTEGVYIHN
jgi:hypothetical protein